MSDDDVDEDAVRRTAVREAKANLHRAIKTFYQITEPDAYVTDWIVITHKETPDGVQSGNSTVGIYINDDTNWVMHRGMLDAALQSARASVSQ